MNVSGTGAPILFLAFSAMTGQIRTVRGISPTTVVKRLQPSPATYIFWVWGREYARWLELWIPLPTGRAIQNIQNTRLHQAIQPLPANRNDLSLE